MPKFVIAYDISDNRRRERVARVLLRYGSRIQQSVFLAWLESEELRTIRRELGSELRLGDLLEIFPIDIRNADRRFSWQQAVDDLEPVKLIG